MFYDMRMHELLFFLDGLTEFYGRAPTREELSVNFFYNRDKLHESGHTPMAATLRRLRLIKAVKETRCSEACHARHIKISAKGAALLEYWNQHGCESESREDTACKTEWQFYHQKVAS
jgi:hypothetical protein